MSEHVAVKPEEIDAILSLCADFGPDRSRLALALKCSTHRIDNIISRHIGRDRWRAAVDAYHRKADGLADTVQAQRPLSQIERVLTFPVRPYEVPIAYGADPVEGEPLTALAYGDVHYPFQDDPTVECVQQIAHALQPDVLLNDGDLIDCFQISRFDKDPNRLDTLQDNIDEARVHLWQMANLCPNSRRVLLEGNHEDRLRKVMWNLEGAQRELPRLRKVRSASEWESLLDLPDIGWEYIKTHDQSTSDILPKVVVKHGTVVRKWSGWTAKAEWERYGRATASGHTHRLGYFAHRDANGVVQCVETGCCCSLDQNYCVDPDWQQGCVVLSWSGDRSLLTVEPVSIRDGKALWRGKVYG